MNHLLVTTGEPVRAYTKSIKKMEPRAGEFSVGSFDDWRKWQYGVWQRGFPVAGYLSAGRWRTFYEAEVPVFIPRIILDIDRQDLRESLRDTVLALDDVFDTIPEEYVEVFFSGSKGFHIEINSAAFGNPIFKSAPDAFDILKRLTALLTTVETDVSVLNPTQSVRVSGSKNLKSGLFKIPLWPNMLRKVGIEDILRDAQKQVPHCEILFEPIYYHEDMLKKAANLVLGDRRERKFKRKKGARTLGPVIERILSGVDEGEMFFNHCGRNKAAFILSCYVLEDESQHTLVANRLGTLPRDPFQTIQLWYDTCTSGTDDVNLRGPFESAKRKIYRGRNNGSSR